VRIGELGRLTGLPAKTIRFYEQAGILSEPDRTAAGYRDYDDTAAPRLRFIRSAQACGLSLAEIRDVIAVRDDTGSPCAHVAGLLDIHATELDQRIRELTTLREEIRRLQHRAATLDPARCASDDVCHILAATDRRIDPSTRSLTAVTDRDIAPE